MMKTNGYIYIDSYILSEYCDKASFVFNIYIHFHKLHQSEYYLFFYLFINDPFFFFFILHLVGIL